MPRPRAAAAQVHKLGVGLPVHTKNGGGWHYKRPLLSNALIKPTTQHILATSAAARQLLRVRYSSPLFRLPSAAAVCEQVRASSLWPLTRDAPAHLAPLLTLSLPAPNGFVCRCASTIRARSRCPAWW